MKKLDSEKLSLYEDLQIEIEKRRTAESGLKEAYQIMESANILAATLLNEYGRTNFDECVLQILQKLELVKISILVLDSPTPTHSTWSSCPNVDQNNTFNISEQTLNKIINRMYNQEPIIGYTKNLEIEDREMLGISCCNSDSEMCNNCHSISLPVHMDKKLWGIITYAKSSEFEPTDLTLKSLDYLSNVITIVIKENQEKQKINKMIAQRLKDFNTKVAQL